MLIKFDESRCGKKQIDKIDKCLFCETPLDEVFVFFCTESEQMELEYWPFSTAPSDL